MALLAPGARGESGASRRFRRLRALSRCCSRCPAVWAAARRTAATADRGGNASNTGCASNTQCTDAQYTGASPFHDTRTRRCPGAITRAALSAGLPGRRPDDRSASCRSTIAARIRAQAGIRVWRSALLQQARRSNGSSGLGKLTPRPYKTPKPGGTGLWKRLLERLRAKAKKRKEEKSLRKLRTDCSVEVSRSHGLRAQSKRQGSAPGRPTRRRAASLSMGRANPRSRRSTG
jgi:hypothetical protein